MQTKLPYTLHTHRERIVVWWNGSTVLLRKRIFKMLFLWRKKGKLLALFMISHGAYESTLLAKNIIKSKKNNPKHFKNKKKMHHIFYQMPHKHKHTHTTCIFFQFQWLLNTLKSKRKIVFTLFLVDTLVNNKQYSQIHFRKKKQPTNNNAKQK